MRPMGCGLVTGISRGRRSPEIPLGHGRDPLGMRTTRTVIRLLGKSQSLRHVGRGDLAHSSFVSTRGSHHGS